MDGERICQGREGIEEKPGAYSRRIQRVSKGYLML